jgi:hypothetical protein
MVPDWIQVMTGMELRTLGAGEEAEEDRPAERTRDEQCAGRHRLGGDIADPAVAQPADDRREQWQEDDELDVHLSPSSG